jgi:3-hydroxybutyryl-CoA dehydrogenase
MGPFELMDLVGLDVNLAAATAIWNGLGQPERLRPSPIQERLIAAGDLGRKTGRGFYDYQDGRRAGVSEEFARAASAMEPAAIRERILAAISLEAHRALDEGVASADDIDRALRLGAGHPFGPFERERGEGPLSLGGEGLDPG